jgi:hypothetical protein
MDARTSTMLDLGLTAAVNVTASFFLFRARCITYHSSDGPSQHMTASGCQILRQWD